jgi:hypothetical protein
MLGKNTCNINKNTESLLDTIRDIGLEVNTEKIVLYVRAGSLYKAGGVSQLFGEKMLQGELTL